MSDLPPNTFGTQEAQFREGGDDASSAIADFDLGDVMQVSQSEQAAAAAPKASAKGTASRRARSQPQPKPGLFGRLLRALGLRR